jgi:hypothetical protein
MPSNIERLTRWMVNFLFVPALQLLLAFGSALAVTTRFALWAAAAQARGNAFCDGISPTSMQSGNLPQAAFSTFYNKNFLENLKAKLVMMRMTTRLPMPAKSGQIYRNFMWPVFPANTQEQAEGTVGTGITTTANFQDYILGQWADYLNISDKALVTSISDDMIALRREMAYRLGLSIDDLIMAIFDYLRVLDPKTANQDATTAAPNFTKAMIEQAPFSLRGQNVSEVDGGGFPGKIHPFFLGDMVALDTTNNSIVDIWKHTPEGQMKLSELPDPEDGDTVKFIELFGCRWMASTNCTTTANWLATGKTAIRTYLAGRDAVISIKLSRENRTDVDDGNYENMKLWMGEYSMGNQADPPGVIGAGTSYNAILAFGPPPDTTSRARCWDAVPQTS